MMATTPDTYQAHIYNISINTVSKIQEIHSMKDLEVEFEDFHPSGPLREGNYLMMFDLHLRDGAHVYVAENTFVHNCGSAIASSSLLTEWVKGRTLDQAEDIKNTQIAEELALPPVKIHCSVLAEDAIKAAIEDYRNKRHDDLEGSVDQRSPRATNQ